MNGENEDENDDDEDEHSHVLVMPFVVCESKGGPFDDYSFVAGYVCGQLDAELGACSATPSGVPALPAPRYVQSEVVPQLDLIAMKHDYVLDVGGADMSGEWTWVVFKVGRYNEEPGDENNDDN